MDEVVAIEGLYNRIPWRMGPQILSSKALSLN
jgi:hypothetical protein